MTFVETQTSKNGGEAETKTISYSYDSAGNRIYENNHYEIANLVTEYTYNILNQLTYVDGGIMVDSMPQNLTHSFTYNANGDLISDTEVRPMEDFTEELQQYPEYYISGSLTKTTDRSYSYDSAGRLTDTENVSTIEGTITKLKDQYGNVVQNLNQELDPTLYKFTEGAYTYNGAGQRVKKEVIMYDENGDALPTVTRKYFYTGDCVLFVADASNNKTIENVHDPSGNILLSQRFELNSNGNFENGWYFFNTDIRGSITSILREDLSFATGYVYDEYGNQIKTGEKDFLNEATYTGAIYDEESDLYFLNARYYDSNTGQFISKDTYLGDAYSPWTQNLYSYTGGNPVNYTDPTGHFWEEITGFFREFVSAVVGMRGQLAEAAGVSQLDSPLPGPADVVAGVLAVGVLVKATIDAAKAAANAVKAKKINVSDVAQSVSAAVPHAVAEELTEKRVKTFPEDPNDFNPVGLIRVYKAGSKNGPIIQWFSPFNSKNAIFEWDRDYRNGQHYHINNMLDDKGVRIHYWPGEVIPEPYSTIYFPF